MVKFLLRSLRLVILISLFPFNLVSMFIASVILPITMIADMSYYLLTGTTCFAEVYIHKYYGKVAFGWYCFLEDHLWKI